MKRILFYTALSLLTLAACTNYEQEVISPKIDLGVKSTSTAIKSIIQTENTVTAVLETTVGAKYAIQVIPFGSDQPIKKEGFTATESLTTKYLNLSDLPKKGYDFIFIDVDGKEVKYPLTIK
jgi:hypothetical protein